MRTTYKGLFLLFMLLGVTACNRNVSDVTSKPNVPNIPNVPDSPQPPELTADMKTFFDQLYACEKEESQQPKTPDNTLSFSLVEEQEIKDREYLNCDGSVRSRDRGPVHMVEQVVLLDAPDGLSSDVHFVEFYNHRTCASHQIEASAEPITFIVEQPATQEFGKFIGSQADPKGRAALHVSNSKLRMGGLFLNLAEGRNVIDVSYLGKCLKYKENKEKSSAPAHCLEAQPLAKKTIVMDLKIDRIEASGVHQIQAYCEEPKQVNK